MGARKTKSKSIEQILKEYNDSVGFSDKLAEIIRFIKIITLWRVIIYVNKHEEKHEKEHKHKISRLLGN